MLTPYQAIFRPAGTKAFSAAAFIARLPVTMAPIGIVAMLSQTHGQYWLAGAVAATFSLSNALIAPQLSRLVDRFGQSAVVAPATAIAIAAFLALSAAAHQTWPFWTLFAAAFCAAAMPSMSAMVRGRWSEIFRGRPELNTAFAFESAADELTYITGASLSVGLAVSLFPEAGVLVSTVLLAVGTAAFLLQRSTEPKVRPLQDTRARGSAIGRRPVQIIALALVFVGAIFATAEVSTVAITEQLGAPGAATWVIGFYAAGSLVLGLILGAADLKMRLERQLLIAISVLAASTLPLLAASASVALLAMAVCVSGIAVSPTFITAYGLIERRVPASMLTEGVTWVGTGTGFGMALGAFVAGWVVDRFGAPNGFWVAVAAGAAALLTILLGWRDLSDEGGTPAVGEITAPGGQHRWMPRC
jgi:MFS family permease